MSQFPLTQPGHGTSEESDNSDPDEGMEGGGTSEAPGTGGTRETKEKVKGTNLVSPVAQAEVQLDDMQRKVGSFFDCAKVLFNEEENGAEQTGVLLTQEREEEEVETGRAKRTAGVSGGDTEADRGILHRKVFAEGKWEYEHQPHGRAIRQECCDGVRGWPFSDAEVSAEEVENEQLHAPKPEGGSCQGDGQRNIKWDILVSSLLTNNENEGLWIMPNHDGGRSDDGGAERSGSRC